MVTCWTRSRKERHPTQNSSFHLAHNCRSPPWIVRQSAPLISLSIVPSGSRYKAHSSGSRRKRKRRTTRHHRPGQRQQSGAWHARSWHCHLLPWKPRHDIDFPPSIYVKVKRPGLGANCPSGGVQRRRKMKGCGEAAEHLSSGLDTRIALSQFAWIGVDTLSLCH